MKDIKVIISSKIFRMAFGMLAGLVVILLVFSVGINVGLHKARYSYQWGENYERNFISQRRNQMDRPMGPQRPNGPMGFFAGDGRDMRNGNGAAGEIVSIAENLIVIKDKDNRENTIEIGDRTIIKSGSDDLKIGDLKMDEKIVVLGTPGENGAIKADLIRVFNK